jgi:glucose/arabinose dehydrogenase
MCFPIRVCSILFTVGFASYAMGQTSPVGDAGHGKLLFQQNCAVCHASGLDPQVTAGQGPLLAGVVGRAAASLSNFSYTPALKNSGLKWDRATLDRFLTSPTTVVPGTNMVLAIPQAADRSDLVAFLATLRPVALPTPTEAAAAARHTKSPGDWQNDAPGAVHHYRVEDLPQPYATRSAGNSPQTVDRPANAKLSVPAGFQVKLYASDLSGPRLMRTAPNGDIFIAETRAGRIRVLRAPDGAETPTENTVFADGLRGPFGIAFYPAESPQWIYIGIRNSVVRFPYRTGDLRARARAETVIAELSETTGGHTTRDVAFSLDGKRMFVSVGSGSNVAEGVGRKSPQEIRAWESTRIVGAAWDDEANRADVLVADPEGHGLRIFATGIRNAAGLAVQPTTGKLWVAVNERDNLGDDLVPDYISHIEEGGYYGWPWYYLGNHEDPRWRGARPDLAGKAIVPDVLIQAHSAALQLTFYPPDISGPSAFPAEYRGQIFAALHGSWNRTGRTGSKIIHVRLNDGVATGDYEDLITGFVLNDREVWGRPVGVTIAHDGALLFSDDANGTVWRVSYRR